jgi:hypothetical protein
MGWHVTYSKRINEFALSEQIHEVLRMQQEVFGSSQIESINN